VAANLCEVGISVRTIWRSALLEVRSRVWHNPLGKGRCNSITVSNRFRQSWCGTDMYFRHASAIRREVERLLQKNKISTLHCSLDGPD
jgi:hypothetical protein